MRSISVGIDEYRTYRLYAYNDFLTDLTSQLTHTKLYNTTSF